MKAYILYGGRLSYFTRKLEAALELYGAPFEYQSKTLELQQEIERRAGTHQMPVLHTPENWMVADTTPVIALLDARFPLRRLFPAGPLGVLVHVVEEWFDEWIARTSIHYRWQYEESAVDAAAAIAGELAAGADPAVLETLTAAVTSWGKRACRATGVSEPAQQRAAEAEYGRVLAALETQLASTRYALGDRPTAVDAVLLGGLRGHFARDPVPQRVVARFERVSRWTRDASAWDGTGALAPFPDSTPFARFVLGEMQGAYRAFVLGNAAARAAGDKAFIADMSGAPVSFLAREYPERSRRMIHERVARQLDDAERDAVSAWLRDVGLDAVFLP